MVRRPMAGLMDFVRGDLPMIFHRRFATAIALSLLAAAAVVALPAAEAQTQRQPLTKAPPKKPVTEEAARTFITEMGNRTMTVMMHQGSPESRNDAFTKLMLDAIDFDSLANQTLGKMARTVTPNDRKEFTELFAAYVIDVAIQKLGSTSVQNFAIGALKPQPNGDIKVNTAVTTGDKPLSIDWRVHDKNGETRINDIEVDGYSLVIHYRGEFERAGVSTVSGLIAKLQGLTQSSGILPVVRTAMK